MIERLLQSHLEPVARRHRQSRLWRSLAVCWAATALVGLLLLWLSSRFAVSREIALGIVAFVFFNGIAVTAWFVRRLRTDYRQVARQIEREHPDLHSLLITAVEQQPSPTTGEFNYLQARVIREAILEVQNRKLVLQRPATALKLARVVNVCAMAVAVLVVARLATMQHEALSPPRGTSTAVTVDPGDVEIERGTSLLVMARFSGPTPGSATLIVSEEGQEPRPFPLQRTLRDPVFGGSVPEVTLPLKYAVEYQGIRTREYNVRVFDYPKLERADAEIKYPDYTGLPEKRVADTRRVTAVEGSHLALSLQLNKPVRSARLVSKGKAAGVMTTGLDKTAPKESALVLETDPSRAVARLQDLVLATNQTLWLELVDVEGRTNKVPSQFIVDVLRNKPPELKIASPRGDQRVSPLEELAFAAEANDDFGLRTIGFTYTMAGGEPTTIQIDTASTRHEKKQLGHLLRLEELQAKPDQLLSWFVWAEDIGPDGNPRRTSSDMYFAEVRPFDEIYRDGSDGDASSASAGMQMGGETMKLAELQKQIINATWKLQRQFPSNTVVKTAANYGKDADVVRESQEKALQQAGAMKARVDDPRYKSLWESVTDRMQLALEQLTEAVNSPAPLPKALNAEQAAYQALLSLSAREYQVTRSRNRSNGGGGGGQRNQGQLDNLDLKEEKDRYETQRQAGPQQKPEQREQLAVLSRLKELAQRQQDLNERLKDLQTALREARTEEQRKEIERELKRLRDEQREMLADMDELAQRMERNQSQMAESRRQLEQTRSHVQNTAEALDKQSVGQALTEGTRAQRDLQQLRDDFRKKNSNQFAEDMREMRQTARELAQKQEEISSKIEAETNQKQKTLTASDEAKGLAEKFQQQKSGFTNLVQNMREISDRAEAAEPMLSRQLYEAVRKTAQGNIENNLSASEELLKRSFLSEAGQFSRRAQQDLGELKRGVEEAASGVLGDEAEALKFAKNELDDLVNKLGKELDRSGAANAATNGTQGARSATATNAPSQSVNGQAAAAGQDSGGQQPNQPGQEGPQTASAGDQKGNPQSNSPQAQGSEGQGQASNQATSREGEQSGAASRGEQSGARQGQRGQQAGRNRGGGAEGGRFDPSRWTQDNSGGAEGGGAGGPMTGSEFRDWSDRLGQVEEAMDQPDLRTEAGRIRDRARALRAEFKRHAREPQWDLVRTQVYRPLTELRNRVAEELARTQSADSLVPIDRDPVPNKFSELVRRYYEKLGDSRPAEKPQ
jgi:hypothetical protein